MGARPPGNPRTAVPPSDPAVNEGHHTMKPAVSSVFAGQLLDTLIQLFRAQNSRKRARRAPMCPSRCYLTKPDELSDLWNHQQARYHELDPGFLDFRFPTDFPLKFQNPI